MTRGTLWLRYVAPVVAAALGVYALCVAAFFAYHKASDTRSPNPLRIYAARVVDYLAAGPPAETEKLERDIRLLFTPVWLVDKTGAPVPPFGERLPVAWEAIPHPERPFEPVEWTNPADRTTLVLVRLERHPDWYFVSRWGPPLLLPHSTLLGPILLFALLSLVVAVISAGALVLGYFRAEARVAESVFARIEAGDLQARFPERKLDEVGRLLSFFNRMAGEIEKLVEKLRRSERARVELLEDLGHDLRTPLTSTTSLVEALVDYGDSMPPAERAESLALIRQELAYVHRLLGDLFLLAGMTEAAYRKRSEPVDFLALVRSEMESQRALSVQAGRPLRVTLSVEDGLAPKVNGDAGLLQRLVRNALENTRRFAREEIALSLRTAGEGAVELIVRDDGPGLSEQALASFGKRRATRVASGAESRLSLGLGSVIMRTIAELHGGSLAAGNWKRDGATAGAEIAIRLPAL